MNRFFATCLIAFLFSCTSSVFKKNFHEDYGKKLVNAGLENTALGKQWFEAANKALSEPHVISVPYKEVGYFSSEKPRASSLRFTGRRGEKLLFQLTKNPAQNFTLYIDLWEIDPTGKSSLLLSVDTAKNSFEYEVEKDITLLLRMQSELLRSGDYTISISSGPSLGFPVQGKTGRIGSFWGDEREGGARSHEGIDIFAARRTPVVAAADGRVASVTENRLGGKVVFMRPSGKNYSLYYAHLDAQLVSEGQSVKKGDTLGLVGNTGNAKNTQPHLHFGIYASGGAVDPFPFVNPLNKLPADPAMKFQAGKNLFRLKSKQEMKSLGGQSSKLYDANILVKALASFERELLVELPDGTIGSIDVSAIESAGSVLKKVEAASETYLLEFPSDAAPKKLSLAGFRPINVHAYYSGFAFVKAGENEGWVTIKSLK